MTEASDLTSILPIDERRSLPRLPCAEKLPLTASLGEKLWNVPVRDISAAGISVTLDQPVEPGTLVSVELPNKTWNCWHLKLLRVVHATQQPDNRWLVGSLFLRRLTDDEFHALVG